jgi:hypothetical protein
MSEHTESVRPGRAAQGRAAKTQRRRGPGARAAWNLVFTSSATNVPVAIVKDSPTLMVAAVEELCWRMAVQDWAEREPPRRDRRRYAAWRSEARRHHEKRERIQAMVVEAVRAS